PAIYVAEYHLGCWTLDRPAARRIHLRQFGLRDYIDWHVLSRVVWPAFWPAFVGSLFLAVPSAIIIYFVMRLLVSRARMPQKTGCILEEQEPRKKLQVGSLMKIATASVALDWAERRSGDLNQAVTIPQEAFAGTLENNIGFQPGDSITLRDLLYAALVQSDNIAAYTLAYHVGSKLESLAPGEAGSKYTPVDAFVA